MLNFVYDKFRLTSQVLRNDVCSVLDVGCRDGILKRYLHNDIACMGIDLIPEPSVDRVVNVEKGLPFTDQAFYAVVALDLLEHTDNIWFVFDELLRVARHQVVVVLPNAYHWSLRLRYLLGNEMGKYVLPPDPILDRHRWLLSYKSIRNFCVARSEAAGWSISERILYGGRRTVLIDWILSHISNNLAAWAVLYVLQKRGGANKCRSKQWQASS
jgi:SAM-dependent methyltransferase